MKKLILLLVVFGLSNCELKVKNVNAQTGYTNTYSYKEERHNGMVYGVWYVMSNSSQTGYAVSVVNLTKDELEVQLLKKQLAKL